MSRQRESPSINHLSTDMQTTVPMVPQLYSSSTPSNAEMEVDALLPPSVDSAFQRKSLSHYQSIPNIDTSRHHTNGTGRLIPRRPRANTYSSEHPYYPGTGRHRSNSSMSGHHLMPWGGDAEFRSSSPHVNGMLAPDTSVSPHLDPNGLPSIPPSPSLQSRNSPEGSIDQELINNHHSMRYSHSQPGSNEHSPLSMPYSLPSSSSASLLSEQTPLAIMPQSGSFYSIGGHSPFLNGGEASTSRERELLNEIAQLKNRLVKVEFHHEQDRRQLQELQEQHELERPLTREVDDRFKSEWHSRTDARVNKLCSLNRAGNALCQWHDSRRERRQFPPRMAPHGKLNCGCTYEEALFEEALARHNIGAYLPGESVRMDPNLRNPLLRLLQEKYGYKDGDFERFKVKMENGEEYWRFGENDGSEAWRNGSATVGNGPRRQRAT